MQGRTFFRIMIDNLFINNPVGKAIAYLVNFCNSSVFYNKKKLKFLGNMPLNISAKSTYQKKFIFDSSYKCGVNAK